MKTGFFTNRFSQFAPFSVKRKLVGWNTGNMIFRDAIQKMVDCDVLTIDEPINVEKYNAFITTDLIWLREDVAPWKDLFTQLKTAGDKRLIPLSIGLQSAFRKKDFKIHPEMVSYLSQLQERTVLPVRGAYTAEILAANGVKNLEIMGCPSIYQLPIYNNNLNGLLAPIPSRISATGNFRTFIGELNDLEKSFLKYVIEKFDGFAEQTFDPLDNVSGMDEQILSWMKAKSYAFFDLETWRRYNERYNFSMGLRFHGNIAALLGNIPALFMVIDSRTREMTDFLSLPAMDFSEFDPDLPLERYYEAADYRDFVRTYPQQLERFASFARRSEFKFSDGYQKALNEFQVT